ALTPRVRPFTWRTSSGCSAPTPWPEVSGEPARGLASDGVRPVPGDVVAAVRRHPVRHGSHRPGRRALARACTPRRGPARKSDKGWKTGEWGVSRQVIVNYRHDNTMV